MFTIYTNNSVVADFFGEKVAQYELKWVAAPAISVLEAVKGATRHGAIIKSDIMSGTREPQQLFGSSFERIQTPDSRAPIRSINPYLSVITESGSGLVDFDSVKNIDEALRLYKKNAKLRFAAHNDDAIRRFQTDDMDVILVTLGALAKLQ
ncbi:MAG: hypothetical protein FWC70_01490 [Defluviitaleaceae bacterium]|nr:hypothetical protein [Defluviitaleaceae bacterium]